MKLLDLTIEDGVLLWKKEIDEHEKIRQELEAKVENQEETLGAEDWASA